MLRMPVGATKEEVVARLDEAQPEARNHRGVDAALLGCEVDRELAEGLLEFCVCAPGAILRLAHNDLGSGTDCEQRLFDRLREQEAKEKEKKFHEQAKRDSSKEKDFSAAAAKKRRAEEGISVAAARLGQLEEEIRDLERRKAETPWYALFAQMESRRRCCISTLDLSDCGLHATGLTLLTHVLLELEHRADEKPVTELILDGNDVGDIGMTAVSSYIRLSSHVRCVRLRNVGITERGVSQVLSSLVSNKSLLLLDLRSNGLASLEVNKAAIGGVQRFNKIVEVLLE